MEDLPVVKQDIILLGLVIKDVPHTKVEKHWGDIFMMSPETHENVLDILEAHNCFEEDVFGIVDYKEK